jgi:septal ring factor EnvC (AmiA/AmiB activator)
VNECPRCNAMRKDTLDALSKMSTARNQVEQTKAFVKALQKEAKKKDARIAAIEAENARLKLENDRLLAADGGHEGAKAAVTAIRQMERLTSVLMWLMKVVREDSTGAWSIGAVLLDAMPATNQAWERGEPLDVFIDALDAARKETKG